MPSRQLHVHDAFSTCLELCLITLDRYLLIDDATNKAAVVDPFDFGKITAAAEKEKVQIGEQLITTHQCAVFVPACSSCLLATTAMQIMLEVTRNSHQSVGFVSCRQ